MTKKAKPKTPGVPKFENGTVIQVPCLIVDTIGVMWWVDPMSHMVKRVVPVK